MIAKALVKIGPATFTFEIEEKTDLETLNKAITLANPPTRCDECTNANPAHLVLDTNKDSEGNIYVNIKCSNCGAKAKLGSYKSGGFFWHKFEKYVKKNSE